MDMIDSCWSCDFLLLYWKQNRKARLTLMDMCCDVSWHNIILIIATIGMCSCTVFPVAGTWLLLRDSFLPLDAILLCDSVSAVSSGRQRQEGDGHVC